MNFAESVATKADAVVREDMVRLTSLLRQELLANCGNIPRELWCQSRWVLWEARPRKKPGKFDKVPSYVGGGLRRGTQGSPADIAQLVTGDQALAAFRDNPRFAGIGYAALEGGADRSLDIADEGKSVLRDEGLGKLAEIIYCGRGHDPVVGLFTVDWEAPYDAS